MRLFVFALVVAFSTFVLAAGPASQPASQSAARATPEQRKFVADQLAKLKVDNVFDDGKQIELKVVVDALVAKGKELLPALKEALPRSDGRSRDACARAYLLLSWGFDPEQVVAKAIEKEIKGARLPAGARKTPIVNESLARVAPDLNFMLLTFELDPATNRLTTPIEPLKTNNIIILNHDGGVTFLSTPKAVEAFFKSIRKPTTDGKPVSPTDESAVRDLLTAWLSLSSLTASDASLIFKPAPETFTIRQNGPRWVVTGRAIPTGPTAEKAGQRQLLLVLNADGTVLTSTETAGLKPLKK